VARESAVRMTSFPAFPPIAADRRHRRRERGRSATGMACDRTGSTREYAAIRAGAVALAAQRTLPRLGPEAGEAREGWPQMDDRHGDAPAADPEVAGA
jgi:hypothetical protein